MTEPPDVRLRDELVAIYEAAVAALSGEALVQRALEGRQRPERLRVLALGKAAVSMLRGAASAWEALEGIAVAPAADRHESEAGPGDDPALAGVVMHEGAHPMPDDRSLHAGQALLDFVRELGPDDHLVALISGGGSALAEVPREGLSLDDLEATTRLLLGSSVPIDEVNVVRRSLSAIKGGGLAAACGAGKVEVLALSDVPGDDPATIASGPFFVGAPGDAAEVLARRGLLDRVPAAVRRALRERYARPPDVRAPANRQKVPEHQILAGPGSLASAAAVFAQARGFRAVVLDFLGDDVEQVAEGWTARLEEHAGARGLLFAAPAEPTVELPVSPGPGGRSQHLALRMALALRGHPAAFLAAGSDGHDGQSDHAGAAVDGSTVLQEEVTAIEAALVRAASADACARLGVALPARSTGTNLADLHLLAFER